MSTNSGGRFLLGSGNAITQKLKQTTAKFAKAIEEPYNTSKQETIKLAQEIEGLLLTEETVNNWDQVSTDALIDQLHDLMPKN